MSVWNRNVWQQPVGRPNGDTAGIKIGLTSPPTYASLVVPVYWSVINAYQIKLFEAGGFAAATWQDLEDVSGSAPVWSLNYTFASEGEKTLYAAFRNPAGYVVGDGETISAEVTIDTSLANGLIARVRSDMVSILRADTCLKTRVSDWDSATDPHVLPGWVAEDPTFISERNKGRLPLVELRSGPTLVVDEGNGYTRFDITIEVRAWLETDIDIVEGTPDDDMDGYMWEIMAALDRYPTLLDNPAVLGHHPASLDPTTERDGPFRVGRMDYLVRAGGVRKDYND